MTLLADFVAFGACCGVGAWLPLSWTLVAPLLVPSWGLVNWELGRMNYELGIRN